MCGKISAMGWRALGFQNLGWRGVKVWSVRLSLAAPGCWAPSVPTIPISLSNLGGILGAGFKRSRCLPSQLGEANAHPLRLWPFQRLLIWLAAYSCSALLQPRDPLRVKKGRRGKSQRLIKHSGKSQGEAHKGIWDAGLEDTCVMRSVALSIRGAIGYPATSHFSGTSCCCQAFKSEHTSNSIPIFSNEGTRASPTQEVSSK